MYLIISCYGCGRFLLAKSGQKTKICPYCNLRLNISRVRVIAKVKSARGASEALRQLKEREK